jgi:riboflavin kinase/FMN adenylyltransferase
LAIAALSADEFISMIKEHLDFTHLVVGYDFALGRGRTGDVKYLKEAGSHSGFSVDVFQPIWSEGETISSSQIRVALIQGKIEKAAQLLGRPYTLSGPVVVGDGRGRLIGIPTANLDFWPEQVLPKIGVYACLAVVGGKSWKAVTNIGFRPTFASEIPAPVVEAHLLDFDGDLYNQELKLKFISRLRDEKKFSGIEALVTQIQQDIQKARHILASIE